MAAQRVRYGPEVLIDESLPGLLFFFFCRFWEYREFVWGLSDETWAELVVELGLVVVSVDGTSAQRLIKRT